MTTHIGLLRETWGQGTTWNILADNGGHEFDWWKDVAVARGEWMEPTARIPTQEWVEGRCANYGFIVYQTTSEDATYWRKFRSREYGTSSYRPSLEVTHETPQATSVADAPRYRTGDTVTATVTIGSTVNASQTRSVQVGVNATDSDTSRLRGVLGWFSYDPSLDTRDPHRNSWVRIPGSPAGFYYDSQATGADAIEPLAECTKNSSTQCTFRFRIRQGFGEIQDNDLDTRLKMDPLADSSPAWDSGWIHRDTNFDILPNDAFHTSADLGEWAGHAASAQLDRGGLCLATSDLGIASWGPSAALARNYDSGRTTAGAFGTGWRFSFERSLTIGTAETVYVDEAGDQHRFTKIDGVWLAPTGCFATLAQSGDGWTLTETDKSVLRFDSAGKLTSEADANGNTTTYAWSGGDLTSITAANGQSISVTMSGGVISAASYATAAGTRTVNYTAGATPSVTYFPGQAEERAVSYSYSASRLSAITQQDWPTTGQSVSESFLYADGMLTEVRFPDYDATSKPDARAGIVYGEAEATISRYGTVGGQAGQACDVVKYAWEPLSGAVVSEIRNPAVADLKLSTTYQYGEDLQVVKESSKDGDNTLLSTVESDYDAQGNLVEQVEQRDEELATTFEYEAGNDQPISEETTHDAQCVSQTDNDYDADGNLTSSVEAISGQSSALSQYSYGDVSVGSSLYRGAQVQQRGKISAGPDVWAQTDFADFAANGEPRSTTYRDVLRSYGGTASDLTETATYDAFGNRLSKTDTSGTTTETNTYDLAGRLLTSTDAKGVTTHHLYDALGNEIESWQSVSGNDAKNSWTKSVYDARGHATGQTTLLWDVQHPNGQTQKAIVTAYDGVGNPTSASDSTVGGEDERWIYDMQGNITSHWEMGVASYDTVRATRSTYDEQGQQVSVTAPGESAATTYIYDLAGNVVCQINPDGSRIISCYDAEGNKTAEKRTLEGYDPNTNPTAVAATSYTYNTGDQLVSTTSPGGLTTTYTYDLLGRQIEAGGSSLTLNSLGWELRSLDADGIAISKSYNIAGRITSEAQGSRDTAYAYNASGLLASETIVNTAPNPDEELSKVSYAYDTFGNLNHETHTRPGDPNPATLKDVATTYDSLGRPDERVDTVSGRQQSWSYPLNEATGTQESENYGSATPVVTQIARNAREQESTRTTTIAAGQTVTRTITDRDNAERWTTTTLGSLSFGRNFNGASQLNGQSGAGFTAAGSYSYDAASGRKSAENLPLALAGTLSSSYAYDATGRLESSSAGGLTATTFDSAGNLTAFTDAGGSASLTYDAANRLTQMSYGAATTHYGWDTANGWRTQQGPSADPDRERFSYTASGRLAGYANDASGLTASYAYDGGGQRIRSEITQGTTTTTTTYLYEGLSLRSLSAIQGETSWRIDYLYDEEGVPYAGIYRSPASSVSPVLFALIASERGDVLELLDSNGDAFTAYRYDEWGNPIGAGNYATGIWTQASSVVNSTLAGQIASRQILRYASYAYDAESGLYYLSARSYDPLTRQFISKDPAKADGEESAYQYCGGEPVGKVDPTGLRFVRSWTKINVICRVWDINLFSLELAADWMGCRKANTTRGEHCLVIAKHIWWPVAVTGSTAELGDQSHASIVNSSGRKIGMRFYKSCEFTLRHGLGSLSFPLSQWNVHVRLDVYGRPHPPRTRRNRNWRWRVTTSDNSVRRSIVTGKMGQD